MKSFLTVLFLLAFCQSSFAQEKSKNKPAKPPQSELFTEGDYQVRQLVVPGFDELPTSRKLFAYFLSQAAMSGSDIFWQQGSRQGIAVRSFMEKIWKHRGILNPRVRSAITQYMFKLYGNHANYDYLGNFKIVLQEVTREDLLKVASEIDHLEKDPFSNVYSEAVWLLQDIFDRNEKTNYMAQQGQDPILDTQTKFYEPGFTHQDFLNLTPEQQNSFLGFPKKTSNGYEIEIAKIGGRYSKELNAVEYYMGLAQEYGTPAEKEMLQAYRNAMRTGDVSELRRAETLWVQNKSEDIEFQMGFIEVYHDPMKIRGSWESFVMVLAQDAVTKKRVQAIRNNAAYFEQQMPVREEFKKAAGFTPPKAQGAYTLCAGGECENRPFAGVNLPNDETIGETYGTKSFGNMNVMKDINQAADKEQEHLEKWLPKEYLEAAKDYAYDIYDIAQIEFHEILGHGSGRNLDGVNDGMMGQVYSALEEMRAETASLYQLMDPKNMEFGILPQMSPAQFENFKKLSLSMFFANYIKKYHLLADDATAITQAHRRAALVMMNYLISKGAIAIQMKEGEYPHVLVLNTNEARRGLGSLWAWIQEAKSTGNLKLAEKLFEQYAEYGDFHKSLRKMVVARMKEEKLPREKLHLNATLKLVTDAEGKPVDVKLEYHNFNAQGLAGVINHLVGQTAYTKSLVQNAQEKNTSGHVCARLFQF